MLARNSYLLAYYCLSNNNIYRVYHVRKFTLPQRIEKMDETSLQIVTIHPNSTWFHSKYGDTLEKIGWIASKVAPTILATLYLYLRNR